MDRQGNAVMASKKKLKQRNKKLQHKLWSIKRDLKYTVRDLVTYQEIVLNLEQELDELRAPKVTASVNGDPVEFKVNTSQ